MFFSKISFNIFFHTTLDPDPNSMYSIWIHSSTAWAPYEQAKRFYKKFWFREDIWKILNCKQISVQEKSSKTVLVC